MTAEEALIYSTVIYTPFAFDTYRPRTCQHVQPAVTAPECGRPALYRAELDSVIRGHRVITCWCAEHTALWRANPEVPVRLLCTLAPS